MSDKAFPLDYEEWRAVWADYRTMRSGLLVRTVRGSWFPDDAPFLASDRLGEFVGSAIPAPVRVELWEVVFPGFGAGAESARAVGLVWSSGPEGRCDGRVRRSELAWSVAELDELLRRGGVLCD